MFKQYYRVLMFYSDNEHAIANLCSVSFRVPSSLVLSRLSLSVFTIPSVLSCFSVVSSFSFKSLLILIALSSVCDLSCLFRIPLLRGSSPYAASFASLRHGVLFHCATWNRVCVLRCVPTLSSPCYFHSSQANKQPNTDDNKKVESTRAEHTRQESELEEKKHGIEGHDDVLTAARQQQQTAKVQSRSLFKHQPHPMAKLMRETTK